MERQTWTDEDERRYNEELARRLPPNTSQIVCDPDLANAHRLLDIELTGNIDRALYLAAKIRRERS